MLEVVYGRWIVKFLNDLTEGSILFVLETYNFADQENANASHVQPLGRHDDGQRTRNRHQTVMREGYAKIAERPKGLYHAFVSAFFCYKTPNILLLLLAFLALNIQHSSDLFGNPALISAAMSRCEFPS